MGGDYKDIEKLLERLAKENPEGMESADPIDESVFKRIEHKALSSMQKSGKGKRNNLALRAVAAAFAIFAVFTAVLYFSDMPLTRANEDPNAVEKENETLMPSSVDMPKYIPERFVLGGVTFEQHQSWVAPVLTYINPDNEEQYVEIIVDGEHTHVSVEYERKISILQKNGFDMTVTIYESTPQLAEAVFMDAKGRMVQVLGTLSEQELTDIVDGID